MIEQLNIFNEEISETRQQKVVGFEPLVMRILESFKFDLRKDFIDTDNNIWSRKHKLRLIGKYDEDGYCYILKTIAYKDNERDGWIETDDEFTVEEQWFVERLKKKELKYA